MNKKHHKKHYNKYEYEDQEFHLTNKTKKLRQREIRECDYGFDDENDELFQQVQRFLLR